jgi:hypothetical protein
MGYLKHQKENANSRTMKAPKGTGIIIVSAGILIMVNLTWTGLGQEERLEGAERSPENILIITDRQEYKPGEVVRVTIKNQSGEMIYCHAGVEGIKHIEKKTAEGDWEKLFAMCQSPHCLYDIGPPQEIGPGVVKTFDWKPLIYVNGTTKTVPAKPGQYRLSLLYQEQQGKDWKSAYSNMFVIQAP